MSRARGRDEVSRRAPPSGELQVDHIVPVREIVDMPNFSRLDWEDQLAIANLDRNLIAVDSRVNASRGSRSWAEEFTARSAYDARALREIQEREETLRGVLQAEIDRRLAASGRRSTP